MTRREFLLAVWEKHPLGSWLFLTARRGNRWMEQPVRNDEKREQNVRAFLKKYPARRFDLYFCPNAFRSPNRKESKALRTPYAWCDIDEADPALFEPAPNFLWESSPGRYQGLWIFFRRVEPINAEGISKYLAYEFDGDRNGWSVTKVLRIPGTYNHKYGGKLPRVRLISLIPEPISPKQLLTAAKKYRSAKSNVRSADASNFDLGRDPDKLLKKHRRKIRHVKARYLLHRKRATEPDRSRQIFIMIKGLVEAGIPWPDIACLIWHNPYFRDKHGPDINALEAEIQRAMTKFNTGE